MVILILTWLISGDLEGATVVAALVVTAVLAGFIWLARQGRSKLAIWLLIGLLFLLITADTIGYGLGSPAAAAYFIPIILAACGLGVAAGLGIAALASALVWGTAVAAQAGRYTPEIPFDLWHLTFSAPLFMVLFGLLALVVGLWTRYWVGMVATNV
ncbi:MAG: hypothetical protein IAE79_09070 [Anaerolinea sp.]|nr:hypothetical protein [Anaerolinea sp.]